MRRIEPPTEPDFHECDIGADLGEVGEDDRGQQFELGRLAVASGHAIRRLDGGPDQPGEVGRCDRPAVHLDPFPVRDEVRLGRGAHPVAGGAKGRVREREHAALAVRAGDQRPANGPLGMIELTQQRAGPPEPEPDPEPAALTQRSKGLPVGETGRRLGHRSPVTRG